MCAKHVHANLRDHACHYPASMRVRERARTATVPQRTRVQKPRREATCEEQSEANGTHADGARAERRERLHPHARREHKADEAAERGRRAWSRSAKAP
eukprot:3072329-Pleurochrysis_carterae.AAC.2